MIFAAGLGTRMRPLTDALPKALIPVGGEPLLAIVLYRLRHYGFREIIINVHHLADQIETYVAGNPAFADLRITFSDERSQLLDTGGGLKHASWFFDAEPFLVVNADSLTNLDLGALYAAHVARPEALATLAVQQRTSSRFLLFSAEQQLCGWQNTKTGALKMSREGVAVTSWAFSGIQVVSPALFSWFPADKAVFSTIDMYLEAAKTAAIYAYPHDSDLWFDVGKPDQLAPASAALPAILASLNA